MNPKNPKQPFDWQEQVGAQPFRLRPQHPGWAILAGFLVSQVVGLGALGAVTLAFSGFNFVKLGDLGVWTAGVLGYSQFFLIPFGMGFVAAYFWLETRLWLWLATLGNTLLACAGAAVVLREGAICLVMVSPLLWIFMLIGALVGRNLWRKSPVLKVSLVPLALLFVWGDLKASAPRAFVTTTTFHSAQSPERLWKYSASYPAIPHPGEGWMVRLGLPIPMSVTGEAKLGGRRDAILTGGVQAGSVVTRADFARRLDFAYDKQPKHPEITHHFVVERGRVELRPDGHGGTWLRGTTWYRINVAPAAYFNGWAEGIVHGLHNRVFKWMDELAKK